MAASEDDRRDGAKSAFRSFFAALSDPVTETTDALDDRLDATALVAAARQHAARTVGPRRLDEEARPDRYRVRVFAELLGECGGPQDESEADDQRRRDAVLYARHAAETGNAEAARRWHLQSIVCTAAADYGRPTPLDDKAKDPLVVSDSMYWILFGTFFARQRDFETVLECAQKAMELDGKNKLGLFVHAATLMTMASSADDDNIETLLQSLNTAHPRFSEGHLLAAVFYRRIEIDDHSNRSIDLAQRFIDEQVINGEAERSLLVGPGTVWEPFDHGGDAALKFATLLLQLELTDLANSCLRSFASTPRTDAYHYLMAVSHYKCGEFHSSLEHLNSMSNHEHSRRQSLQLLAHNKYGMGRTQEAVTRYIGLSFSPIQERYSMAYSRSAEHFMAVRRYAEAADAFYRACSVTRNVSELMVKLGVCLLAVHKYQEAERILAGAVAMDGAYEGRAWHYLGEVYEKLGFVDMSDVCRRQATGRGFHI